MEHLIVKYTQEHADLVIDALAIAAQCAANPENRDEFATEWAYMRGRKTKIWPQGAERMARGANIRPIGAIHDGLAQ